MCGLAGFVVPTGGPPGEMAARVKAMADRIVHRGPDDQGLWVDGTAGIALAHRRLSILDLSTAGHQPMTSHSDRYVLVYNGEIYNHLEMRAALAECGHISAWQGHSDTETLLAAIDCWGLEGALKKAVGMFALALWDRQMRTVSLARDRMGEKPLYYGWSGGTFLFGSELKAITAHPAFVGDLDRRSLSDFLFRGYIKAPGSIWRGISKLLPGCVVTVGPDGKTQSPRPYWSLADQMGVGQAAPFSGDEGEGVDALENRLRQAVAGQVIADVPLGAFLSGGIDSSTVVALMQAQSTRAVKTFTIGFEEAAYNEADHARAVADHLGTDHTEMTVTADETRAVIPQLPDLYDEPMADPSAIPTFLVSGLARRSVTVSLSGDGGDELLAGYHHYGETADLWTRTRSLPAPVRRVAGTILARAVPDALSARLRGMGHQLSLDELGDFLDYRRAYWRHPESILNDMPARMQPNDWPPDHAGLDVMHQLMLRDGSVYLPDDILVKVDRASMGVSLESRAPLLDHRVVELAASLPLHLKQRDGQGKWALRQVLYRYVPQDLVDRPKAGFGVPISAWLRGPLRDWAQDLLFSRPDDHGLWCRAALEKKWRAFVDGQLDPGVQFWSLCQFLAWSERHGR